MEFNFLKLWRERRNQNRYDLNKLREIDAREKARLELTPEADSPTDADRNHVYCHHCGGSMSQAYSICPDCGVPLGT